ncbi:MAG TPA: EcsC family protein [Candidatus Cottocaccamicrobium excrementipullorum]|nr:EcsC family protein [Candidatus Cottocaccamicrobium excrementipullorum]
MVMTKPKGRRHEKAIEKELSVIDRQEEALRRAAIKGRTPQWKKTLEEKVKEQTGRTADAFAMDMVLLKFIQGLPVVGILGGAGNPLYYNKVMKYAELKYRKRYLLKLMRKQNNS